MNNPVEYKLIKNQFHKVKQFDDLHTKNLACGRLMTFCERYGELDLLLPGNNEAPWQSLYTEISNARDFSIY